MLINLASKTYDPISRSEEQILFQKYIETRNPKIRDRILNSNYRFVMLIVRRYVKSPDEIEDSFSAGCMGMVKALDKFNNDKNIKFISYAVFWIKQAIFNQFYIEKKEEPDGVVKFSLDNHNDDDEQQNTIEIEQTTFECPAESRHSLEIKTLLNQRLAELTMIEENMLRLHYVNEVSYEDIGKYYNMSHERVRTAVRKVISKLNKNRSNKSMQNYASHYFVI